MRKILFALLFISFFSYATPPSNTFDIHNGTLQNHPDLCAYGYNPNCQNNSPSARETIYLHRWGAIAISDTSSVLGSSKNQQSQNDAEKNAIKNCQYRAKSSCKLIQVYANFCASVAVAAFNKSNSEFFTATGETKNISEQNVMQKCKNAGYKNCHLAMNTECSFAI